MSKERLVNKQDRILNKQGTCLFTGFLFILKRRRHGPSLLPLCDAYHCREGQDNSKPFDLVIPKATFSTEDYLVSAKMMNVLRTKPSIDGQPSWLVRQFGPCTMDPVNREFFRDVAASGFQMAQARIAMMVLWLFCFRGDVKCNAYSLCRIFGGHSHKLFPKMSET